MGLLLFLKDYVIWHYTKAVRDFFGVSRDFLWFGYHFFSLPLLARTLFAPFTRISTGGISFTDIEGSLQNITINLISRAVGFILRSIVIAAGAVFLLIMAPLLAAAFILWLLLPLAIIFLFALSINIFS